MSQLEQPVALVYTIKQILTEILQHLCMCVIQHCTLNVHLLSGIPYQTHQIWNVVNVTGKLMIFTS